MAQELVYTSAQKGLRPGTRGFCTVAYTDGLRPQSVQMLESLSAYKELYPVHDPRAAQNPVGHTHYRYTLEGWSVSILSRIGPALADHTNRSNKIAHHVVLTRREFPVGGPAWLCSQAGFFLEAWTGEPRRIPEPKPIPAGDPRVTKATEWEKRTGDAGWAGVLAQAFLSRPTVPAFLVFAPGMSLLPLLVEAEALLPPEQRWQVTFSTYFSFLPAGTSCCWRCCVRDSEALKDARRDPRALVIDLTQPLSPPPDQPLVRRARGVAPPPSPPGSMRRT